MAVNVGKTAALLTGSQLRVNMPPPLQLRGQNVKWERSVKYLGVLIDGDLSMRSQTSHAVHQAKAARALLRPVLISKLPLKTKVCIYKMYIRSRLTYAAPAWYALCSASQRKRIQVVQNVSLRMSSGAPWCVRNDVIARDVQIQSVEEFVVRMSRRMFDCADNGPHPHLHNIAPPPPHAPLTYAHGGRSLEISSWLVRKEQKRKAAKMRPPAESTTPRGPTFPFPRGVESTRLASGVELAPCAFRRLRRKAKTANISVGCLR